MPSVTETDSEIKQVYLAYPRHVGPEAALKAIQKAAERLVKERVHPDDRAASRWLWRRARQYAASPAGQSPPKGSHDDYRPHPSTWFNQRRFDDDPKEWLKSNGVNGNGRAQSNGSTKADRTLEASAAAIERIENRTRSSGNGHQEGWGDVANSPGDRGAPTIDGDF